MRPQFVPGPASTKLAQEFWAGHNPVDDLERKVQRLRLQIRMHHAQTGMSRNPEHARIQEDRYILRAAEAPLIYAIEQELAQDIQSAQRKGEPVALPAHQQLTYFDKCLTRNNREPYGQQELAFLRTASALGYEAGSRVIARILNDQEPRLLPFWRVFWRVEPCLAELPSIPRDFDIRSSASPRERLLENVVSSSTSALRVFTQAARHGFLNRPEQLSWTASTSDEFFESRFPKPNTTPSAPCAFAHNEKDIAAGAVWSVASLKNGPWRVPKLCPASVPDPNGITAAQLLMESLLIIAKEVPWS